MTVCARSHRDFAPIDTALGLLVHFLAGSGLGLAIAREIATRHGALITLHASGLGGLAARVEFVALPEAAQVSMLGAQAPLRVRDVSYQSATF
jgi:signal transduction histidine kinase